MSVYVDQFPGDRWGRWNGGGHLMADTQEELHVFAQSIGLKRSWFQGPPEHSLWHYDVTANKRRQALAAGAIPVEIGFLPSGLKHHR